MIRAGFLALWFALTMTVATAAMTASTPSSDGYMAAMEKMHANMSMEYTGDADVDFVRGMIPHHQGAVDMAKVELAFGKDPEMRKLAENIVSSQQKEIEFMEAWLKAHGQ